MPGPLNTKHPTQSAVRFGTTVSGTTPVLSSFGVDEKTRWTWACRALSPRQKYTLVIDQTSRPRVADVAVVEVEQVNRHTSILTPDKQSSRLRTGDKLVGVFGNHYATDDFEALVHSADDVHILTSAGMLGTVLSKHRETQPPTQVRLLGYLGNVEGQRINLKAPRLQTVLSQDLKANVILAVGTGSNSAKATTTAKLVESLLGRGARVAACKLTGSVCHRDLFDLRATSAHDVRDFSDYGFPSTYLCDRDELVNLFQAMLADTLLAHPDVIVMEMADDVLQRETQMVLQDVRVRQHVSGLVLSAPCASSAHLASDRIRQYGHEVIAVTGPIAGSPLLLRELAQHSDPRVASTTGHADELAEWVLQHCRIAAA